MGDNNKPGPPGSIASSPPGSTTTKPAKIPKRQERFRDSLEIDRNQGALENIMTDIHQSPEPKRDPRFPLRDDKKEAPSLGGGIPVRMASAGWGETKWAQTWKPR